MQRRDAAFVCLGMAWLLACGCQGPQLDRLDGSTSTYSSSDPIVDNGPPPAHPIAHDAPSPPGPDALAQNRPLNEAAIAENLNSGHREAAQNHYEQAEAYYRKALDLDPDNPLANHRLAILADRRGDFAVSERCYLKALSSEPNNADLLSDLGYSYYLQGRTHESERCLEAAVRANPTHQLALDNLSLLYAKLGDRERTLEILKRSLGESAAQARLAQLFPTSRTTVPEDDTFTASFAPFSKHETQVAAHAAADQPSALPTQHTAAKPNEQRPASTSNSIATSNAWPTVNTLPPTSPPHASERAAATAQSPLEKQLAALMEQERQRALDERAQRQMVSPAVSPVPVASAAAAAPPIASPSQAVTHWSDPPSLAALRPQPQPAAMPSVPSPSFGAVAPRAIPTDRVPDDRINDAFSAIDREGTEAAIAPSPTADTFAPPPRPTSTPQAVPTGANATWEQSAALPPTALSPTALPREERATTSAFPPIATTPPDSGASTMAATQNLTAQPPARTASDTNSSDTNSSERSNTDARTASGGNNADEWDAARSGTPATQTPLTPTPDPDVPSSTANMATANPSSPAQKAGSRWTAASLSDESQNPPPEITISSGSAPPRKTASDANGWDHDSDPTPRWPGTGGAPAGDRTPSGAANSASSFDWQTSPSPRIVPVSVVPAPAPRATDRSRAAQTGDALDDFETQLQKNRRSVTPGKSTSNRAIAGKPSVQPLPSNRQAAVNGSRSPGASAAGDPWSPQIQARRDPGLFAPDDGTNADKQPATPKSTPAAAATNWSDLPTWQSPASASPPGDNGPTIRPGS